jgi:hypothetical protein
MENEMKKEEMIQKIQELLESMDEDEVSGMLSTVESYLEVTRYTKSHAPKVR